MKKTLLSFAVYRYTLIDGQASPAENYLHTLKLSEIFVVATYTPT